jgi:hypothetical protein
MAKTIPATLPLQYLAIPGRKVVNGDGTTTHPGVLAMGRCANYALARIGCKHHIAEIWAEWEANDEAIRIPTLIAGGGPFWWLDITPGWTEVYCAFYVVVDNITVECGVTVHSRSASVTTVITNLAYDWIPASATLAVSDVGYEEIYLELYSDGAASTIDMIGFSLWEAPRTSL